MVCARTVEQLVSTAPAKRHLPVRLLVPATAIVPLARAVAPHVWVEPATFPTTRDVRPLVLPTVNADYAPADATSAAMEPVKYPRVHRLVVRMATVWGALQAANPAPVQGCVVGQSVRVFAPATRIAAFVPTAKTPV